MENLDTTTLRGSFLQIDDEPSPVLVEQESSSFSFKLDDDWEEAPTVKTTAPQEGEGAVLVGGLPGIYEGDRFNEVTSGAFTSTAQAREAFGIPSSYQKVPATHPISGERVKNANWVINSDSGKVIGNQCVSDGYHLIQPSAMDILDDFVRCADGTLRIVKGGTWNEDAVIWLQTDELSFDGPNQKDEFKMKVLISNTYDRSGSFVLALTPMNVICKNFYYQALAGSRNKFAIRHTKSAGLKLDQLKQAFGAVGQYKDAVMREFLSWGATPVTLDHAARIARAAFGVKPGEEDEMATRTKNKVEKILDIYETGGEHGGAQPGTKYGLAQMITAWSTHEYSKTTGLEGLVTTGAGRWESKAFGIMNEIVPNAPVQRVFLTR
tara:strand:- start:741 stop:1880 length:1140 start_codon:yes stop_codon:yes gene_type:complete